MRAWAGTLASNRLRFDDIGGNGAIRALPRFTAAMRRPLAERPASFTHGRTPWHTEPQAPFYFAVSRQRPAGAKPAACPSPIP